MTVNPVVPTDALGYSGSAQTLLMMSSYSLALEDQEFESILKIIIKLFYNTVQCDSVYIYIVPLHVSVGARGSVVG
jgi:hypothetical protein